MGINENIIQSPYTKLKWRGCRKYTDKAYRYPTCQLQSDGDDLCYKFRKFNGENWYITIKAYKSFTALDIENMLISIGWDNRHTREALYHFYKDNDLDLGFVKKHLKDFKR